MSSTPTPRAGPSWIDLGMKPEQAQEHNRGIATGARAQIAKRKKDREESRRRRKRTAVARDLLANGTPAELSADWSIVRDAYGEYPGAHRDLARLHPAPYIEYTTTIEATPAIEKARREQGRPPLTGQPIRLGKMHVEGVQVMMQHNHVIWRAARGHMKTTSFLGFLEWRIGRNRDLRIKMICEDNEPAKNRVTRIRNRIDRNPQTRDIFPDLVRDELGQWAMNKIQVQRSIESPEPTLQGYGILSGATGGRADITALDDPIGAEIAIYHPATIPKANTAWNNDHAAAGLAGAVYALCNYWVPHEFLNLMIRNARRGVEPEPLPSGGYLWVGDDFVIVEHAVRDFESPWSERFTREELLALRSGDDMNAAAWARGYECREPTAAEANFREDDMHFVPRPPRAKAQLCIQRADSATTTNDASAYSAIATGYVIEVPLTASNPYGLQLVVADVQRAKVDLPSKITWAKALYAEHRPEDLGVEAAQDGHGFAELLEVDLGIEVVHVPVSSRMSKAMKTNRHIPMFRRGLVAWAEHLDPLRIAEHGDLDAANPVGEILGQVETKDCMDAVEMLVQAFKEACGIGEVADVTTHEAEAPRTPAQAAEQPKDTPVTHGEAHPLIKAMRQAEAEAAAPSPFGVTYDYDGDTDPFA